MDAVVTDYSERVWMAGAEPQQTCPTQNSTQDEKLLTQTVVSQLGLLSDPGA